MKVDHLSPSKLSSARLCEARLLAKVEDDAYSEAKGEPAAIGTLAHEAAKLWYRRTTDDPNEAFSQAITNCSSGRFGNENPQKNESIVDAKTLFKQIITKYPRQNIKVVFAERRLKGRLKNGVPVHLIIDLAIDAGDGVLRIIDHKTGNLTMKTDEMYDSDQVLMNLLAINKYDTSEDLEPYAEYITNSKGEKERRIRVEFVYYWVKTDATSGPVRLSNEQLDDYDHFLAVEYQRLSDLTPENVKETINPFCSYCGRKLECKAYRELMTETFNLTPGDESGIASPEEVKKLSEHDILERYARIGQQEKMLKKNKSTLSDMLSMLHKQTGEKTIQNGKFKSTLVQMESKDYDTSTVLSLAVNRGVAPASMLKPQKKRVEDAFGSDEDAMALLASTAIKSVGSKYPRISESKINAKTKKV